MIFTKLWWRAAIARALRTMAQTAAAMLPAAATVEAVNWRVVAGTAVLAALASLLTSLGGLPEASEPPAGQQAP